MKIIQYLFVGKQKHMFIMQVIVLVMLMFLQLRKLMIIQFILDVIQIKGFICLINFPLHI